MAKTMELRLLGTGAADHDWNRFGAEDVRGSASSLLNGRVLIDCGATGLANLRRFNIPCHAIEALLLTHSHDDHCCPGQIAVLAAGRTEPMAVYADPEVLRGLSAIDGIKAYPLIPGEKIVIGDFAVTALPANHPTGLAGETALHFCFEHAAGCLLYALDGAGLLKQAVQCIQHLCFDWIVLDATMADAGDYRIFEHTDIDMAVHLMKTLRALNIAGPDTRVILDHMARALWPDSEEERLKKIAGTGFELGYDGMRLAKTRR